MRIEIPLTLAPMEAESVDALPEGAGWLFEQKYDGFRCLAFRDGETVKLQSRRQKPLERFFPELAAGLQALPVTRFVLDGEIVIPNQDFDTLQLRLHPAASRIQKLAGEFPARLVAFDLLAGEDGRSLMDKPFSERRAALEALIARLGKTAAVQPSKTTKSRAAALKWLGQAGLDGIMAKPLDLPYRAGQRAMQKYKKWKTVDCVIGGLYMKEGTRLIEYLLLGLYDDDGKLNYVGRVPVHGTQEKIDKIVAPFIGGAGFTGRSPAGKNRWSGKERKPVLLTPELVAEVSADHLTGAQMRHSARLLRWRDDKPPKACTMDQIAI